MTEYRTPTEQQPFTEWAIVELLGHRRLAGHLQEVQLAGAGFLRLDIPEADGDPARTQYIAPGSVYALHPVTEATARAAARSWRPEPVQRWELPDLKEIESRDEQPVCTDPWCEHSDETHDAHSFVDADQPLGDDLMENLATLQTAAEAGKLTFDDPGRHVTASCHCPITQHDYGTELHPDATCPVHGELLKLVACKAPDPNRPNWFCARRLDHGDGMCVYVPAEALPASTDDEGEPYETVEFDHRGNPMPGIHTINPGPALAADPPENYCGYCAQDPNCPIHGEQEKFKLLRATGA